MIPAVSVVLAVELACFLVLYGHEGDFRGWAFGLAPAIFLALLALGFARRNHVSLQHERDQYGQLTLERVREIQEVEDNEVGNEQ